MNAVLSDARRGHRGLFWFAVAMGGLSVALVMAALVDPRTLLGAPLWFKPLKFALSFTAYASTLAWMLGQLREPAMQRTGWLIVATSAIEVVIIVGQAGNGVASHFNDDGGTGELLWAIMTATVVVLYLATISVALRVMRERGLDPAVGAAMRVGLLVALIGMGVGILMGANDAHAVGVPDGGPGLPFVGWSTTGGDLRIAHFAGMHALQLLPLSAVALAAVGRLGEMTRARIVTSVGVGYGAFVVLLTWQALRGQPLLAPDPLTWATLAVIVAGTAGAALAAVRSRPRQPSHHA